MQIRHVGQGLPGCKPQVHLDTFCKGLSWSSTAFGARYAKGEVQIIGVGGVDSGKSAFEKITAGADAVQLYTGMVYKGPGIVKEIKKELISILKKENLKNISEAVGINA